MFTIDFIESKERFESPLLQSASSSGGEGVVYLLNTASLLVSCLFPIVILLLLLSFIFVFLFFCLFIGYSRKNSNREGWGWIRISSGVKNVEFPSCGLLWNFRLEFQGQCRISSAIAHSYPPPIVSANPNPRGGGYETVIAPNFHSSLQGWQAWWCESLFPPEFLC